MPDAAWPKVKGIFGKDADPDIPILIEAKQEYERLK